MAPDGFLSRWRTVGGLRLHALEWDGGSGLPVVLLPGLVTASRSMIPLARVLAAALGAPWLPGRCYWPAGPVAPRDYLTPRATTRR